MHYLTILLSSNGPTKYFHVRPTVKSRLARILTIWRSCLLSNLPFRFFVFLHFFFSTISRDSGSLRVDLRSLSSSWWTWSVGVEMGTGAQFRGQFPQVIRGQWRLGEASTSYIVDLHLRHDSVPWIHSQGIVRHSYAIFSFSWGFSSFVMSRHPRRHFPLRMALLIC